MCAHQGLSVLGSRLRPQRDKTKSDQWWIPIGERSRLALNRSQKQQMSTWLWEDTASESLLSRSAFNFRNNRRQEIDRYGCLIVFLDLKVVDGLSTTLRIALSIAMLISIKQARCGGATTTTNTESVKPVRMCTTGLDLWQTHAL